MIYDAVRFHNGAGRNGHCATMAPCTPEANTPSQPQPLDLAELVRLREEDIAKLDVAEIQLACAAGLPGSIAITLIQVGCADQHDCASRLGFPEAGDFQPLFYLI